MCDLVRLAFYANELRLGQTDKEKYETDFTLPVGARFTTGDRHGGAPKAILSKHAGPSLPRNFFISCNTEIEFAGRGGRGRGQ